ncbi:MAG: hypothetical protein ACI4N3_01450 [Alphaproteobacteria bacterium]
MLIDKFIEFSKQMDNHLYGGNKKCFLFDEYALLVSSSFVDLKTVDLYEEKLKKEIQIINKLENDGVSVIPPLEYKIDASTIDRDEGDCSIYCLQKRAKGEELYNSKMSIDEYETRLKEVSNMSSENLNKFISDWIAINNAGISVDPSKCGNFFLSDGKISFIDLNFNESFFVDEYKEKRMKVLFMESYVVLTGAGLKFKYDKEGKKETKYYDYIRMIFNNLLDTFMEKGIPTDLSFQKVVKECYTDNVVIEELLEKNKKYNQSLQFDKGMTKISDINQTNDLQENVKIFENNINR